MNRVQEKLAEQLFIKLIKGIAKPKKIAMVYHGKLITGTSSLHKTTQARRWNTLVRFRLKRLYETSRIV